MEWPIVSLGDVCQIEKEQFREGNFPYVGMEDIEGHTGRFLGELSPKLVASSTFKFSNIHVLYGRLRPYLNKVLVPDFDGHCSSEIFPLKPVIGKLERKFLYYWLSSGNVVEAIDKTCTGARMPRANVNEVLTFEFPLPPIPEQKRIVTILDQVFADIEQARAKTEQNLKNARELFESYLQQVFSQSGDGWIEAKLSDVCEGKITDGTHQTPKYFDEGYIFLSSRNVTSGEIDWNNIKYIDEAQHVAMQKRLSPRLNDILLAKNGTTGVAAIVDRDVVFDIYVSLALLRPSNKILPRYLLHFVNSSVAKSQFNKRLKGVGVPNLHLEEIRDVVISYPTSIKKQQQLVKNIDLLLEQRNVLVGIYMRKLAAINELKKSILQKAFTGQLTNKKGKGVAA